MESTDELIVENLEQQVADLEQQVADLQKHVADLQQSGTMMEVFKSSLAHEAGEELARFPRYFLIASLVHLSGLDLSGFFS